MAEGITDINQQDEEGWTQLHIEAVHNDVNRVKVLLLFKADPTIRSFMERNTPINVAVSYGKDECVKILLHTMTKECLNGCNYRRKTTLDLAISFQRYELYSMIYDAGGRTSFFVADNEPLLIKLIQSRKNIKSVLVVFFALGKKTKRIHKDLISTIAKMIWETRDEEAWSLQKDKEKC